MDNLDDLIKKLNDLLDKQEYQQILDELRNSPLQPSFTGEIYSIWAKAYYWLGMYEDCIQMATEALRLDPADYEIQYYRGVVYSLQKKDDKAISDFDTVIKMKPEYYYPYRERGRLKYLKGNYSDAIEDYSHSIQLNPENVAYYERANTYYKKGDYKAALDDYNSALKYKDDMAYAYAGRGNVYRDQGRDKDALDDYEKAIGLDSSLSWLQSEIDNIKAKLGRISEIKPVKEDSSVESVYFLIQKIDELAISENEKQQLKNAGVKINEAIMAVKGIAFIKNTQPVAHYTKLRVADILVSAGEDAFLRYYNVVYMNDPEEGKVLFDYFDDDDITESFNAVSFEDDNNIYLGSFMPASTLDKTENHEDELVMWRTYGKDEKRNEAAGCCIVLAPEFFGRELRSIFPLATPGSVADNPADTLELKAMPQNEQALYTVLYYDKKQNSFAGKNGNDIKDAMDKVSIALKDFIRLKDKLKEGEGQTKKNENINRLVYRFLSEIRYLFKSSDYAFEKELRVTQYAAVPKNDLKNNIVKIDPFAEEGQPKRLYVESNKPVQKFIKKIILGPKVPNPAQWVYLDTAMRLKGLSIELKRSERKFQ